MHHVVFASPHAAEGLYATALIRAPGELAGLLDGGGRTGPSATLVADLLTHFAHATLSKGGAFRLRWLPGATSGPESEGGAAGSEIEPPGPLGPAGPSSGEPELGLVLGSAVLASEDGALFLHLERPPSVVKLDSLAELPALAMGAYGRPWYPALHSHPAWNPNVSFDFPVDAVLLLGGATLLFKFVMADARSTVVGSAAAWRQGTIYDGIPREYQAARALSADGLREVLRSLPAAASRNIALLFVAPEGLELSRRSPAFPRAGPREVKLFQDFDVTEDERAALRAALRAAARDARPVILSVGVVSLPVAVELPILDRSK